MFAWTRTANPVEWLELRHQQRSVPGFFRRWRLLGPAALIAAFVVIALTLTRRDSPTREMAIYTLWIVHALVAARCIAAGANAISREHVGQTWDTLVLTGISARQILLGKWLAVLRQVVPWMVAFGALRLLMLPVFMMAFVNRYAWIFSSRSNSIYTTTGYSPIDWVPWASGAAVLFTLLLTVLEVMCCTAIGLAASAATRRGWTAMVTAICVRFAPVVLFAAFTRYEVGTSPSWRVLRFPPLALADGGSAPLYQLVLPLTSWTTDSHVNALPGLVSVGIMLIVMLVVSLICAWWAIRSAGALPHPRPQSA